MEMAQTYAATVTSFGALALLMLVQLLIADFIGIRARHIPGSGVTPDHSNVLFRASRTVANTNESIAIFILAALFSMLSGAAADHVAYSAWAFVVARFLYAICYYLNWQIPRSVVFAMSLIPIVVLITLGFTA